MKVRALKLEDVSYGNQWFDEVEDHWDYEEFIDRPEWRKGWVSMDCALYNPGDDRVYLGVTSFAAEIFKAYDRGTGHFVDLGYSRIADPFDAKFHRSLVKGTDGCLYAAIALLHDVDHHWDAPGSPIVKYDPRSGVTPSTAQGTSTSAAYPPARLVRATEASAGTRRSSLLRRSRTA